MYRIERIILFSPQRSLNDARRDSIVARSGDVALCLMTIPTEPIGSIPRPAELVEAMQQLGAGRISQDQMRALYDRAIRDTIRRFEETGSPIITDGEQTKPSFATYPIHGLETLAPGGGHDSLCRRPYTTAAETRRRSVPIPDVRGDLSRRGEEARACTGEAGGHFGFRAQSPVSAGGYSRVLARRIPRGSAARSRA